MAVLETLVLVAALTAPGETVLLQFSSEHCGPCRTMAPVVKRLAADGLPVRTVDVDRERDLAAQFRVTGVPCFVMIAEGREVERLAGPTSYDRLAQMIQTARFRPAAGQSAVVRGQSPDGAIADPFQRTAGSGAKLTPPHPDEPQDSPESAVAADAGGREGNAYTLDERALLATVRLKIDEGKTNSYGTGTIIDVHGDEALVLTCGHVFRDSRGKGAITVEYCTTAALQRGHSIPDKKTTGHLIAYDLKRDVALVSIRPDTPAMAVQVAPASYRPQRGANVFSVGCDHGGEARLARGRVAALDKYVGHANIEVTGAPAEGRSGGGLFSEDGFLIGVCNAADPADNEGIYAALPSLHWQLAQIGQQAIFERAEVEVAKSRAAQPHSAVASASQEMEIVPRMADQMPPARERRSDAPAREATNSTVPPANLLADSDTEVICIIRSRTNPQGKRQTIVLDRLSPELLDRLNEEYRNAPHAAARQEIAASPTRPPADPRTGARNAVRAQSLK